MNPTLLDPALLGASLVNATNTVKTVLLVVCCVLYSLCALLLIVAILLQESKGGGLAALGGTRAESAFGASNPLRKMTVVLSIIFFVLAGGLSLWLRPPPTAFKAIGEPEAPNQKPPDGTSPFPLSRSRNLPRNPARNRPRSRPSLPPRNPLPARSRCRRRLPHLRLRPLRRLLRSLLPNRMPASSRRPLGDS